MEYVKVYDSEMHLLSVLENADAVGYTLVHNDLWTGSFSLPNDDPKNKYCQPGAYVMIPDGPRKTGLYRISGIPGVNVTGIGEMTTYEVEHVLATLLDDVIFGEIDLTDKTPQEAFEALLVKQTEPRWVLGDVEYTEPLTIKPANETLLSAIQEVCKELPDDYTWVFDTDARPWVLHIRHADTDDGCGIHYARNMVEINKSVDASQIVTRLYLAGGADSKTGKLVRVDGINNGLDYIQADTLETWGVRCAIYGNGDITTPEELLARGKRVLETYKNPYYTYQATALDLYRVTGFEWDNYMPGKMVRVMDTEHGVLFSARIVTIEKRDVFGDPGGIIVTIANQPRDQLNAVSALVEKVGSMGGGGGGGGMNAAMKQTETELREIIKYARVEVEEANAFIKLVAGVESKDEFNKSKYHTLSEASLAIDGNKSLIEAKADRIELNGLVTMTEMKAETAEIVKLLADYVKADEISADIADIRTLKAGNFGSVTIDAGSVISTFVTGTSSVQSQGDVVAGANLVGNNVTCSTINGKTLAEHIEAVLKSFPISDMPGYEAAMDAARSEGAASNKVTDVSRSNYAYNSGERAYSIHVNITLASGDTVTKTIILPAGSAYDNGYEKGVQDGREAGYDDGYEDGKADSYEQGWIDGYNKAASHFNRSNGTIWGPAKTTAYGSEQTKTMHCVYVKEKVSYSASSFTMSGPANPIYTPSSYSYTPSEYYWY